LSAASPTSQEIAPALCLLLLVHPDILIASSPAYSDKGLDTVTMLHAP